MIHCKELNRDFSTKKELFKALLDNKSEIVSLKKAAIKFSDPSNLAVIGKDDAVKSLVPLKNIGYGDYVYPVINTTKYLDSHLDVHLDGIWKKSAKEQTGKTYLLINHDMSIGKVISQPKDVEIMVKSIAWKELGKDYDGETEALIFKSKLTEKSNRDGYLAYKDNDPVEHSIRMQYVRVDLAVNDDSEDFKEEKKLYDSVYKQLANKEIADETGYFWAVSEAKIAKEGSMVLAGSNNATPTLYDIEPQKSTQDEAANALQDEQKQFYKSILN